MKSRLMLLASILAMVSASYAQRIAVLSDIHVSPGNVADSVIRHAVDEINADNFDLVVVNGDLTNEGADAELTNIHAVLSGIRHPMVVVPGNHENNWSQSAGKTFVDLWGNDRFATTLGNLAIVGINCGPYMKMGDGHVKQEDLHWLRATLDSLTAIPGRQVVSFNHYPLRKDDLDNYIEYIELLQQYPTIVHINGHYHHWQDYKAGNIPAVMVRALAMKDGTQGYSILEIDPQWIHVYEKVLDRPATPRYAYAVTPGHAKVAFDHPQMPDSVAGFTVRCLWTDSASVFTRLAFDDNSLYFGTSDGYARAIDRGTGRMLWQSPVGGSVYSRPAVLANGRVAVPYNSGIRIFDVKDGHMLSDMPSEQGPYIADGLVTGGNWLQGGYKRFENRDPRSGKVRWVYRDMANYPQAEPAVSGNDVIFGAWDTWLRCLDVKTGKLRWQWSNGKSQNLFSPGNVVPAVTDDKVFIVAPDRYMTAIDRKDGTTVWRDNSHRYRESMGVSRDGNRVYAKTMDGELVAVDTDGDKFNELWTLDLGLGYDHAPCVIAEVDDIVYTGSRRGLVTATDVSNPTRPHILWSLPLGVSEVNGIDVDRNTGDVYVSLIEGSIWHIARK